MNLPKIFAFVALGLSIWWLRSSERSKSLWILAFKEASTHLIDLTQQKAIPLQDPVYLTHPSIHIRNPLSDPDFGLTFSSGVKYQRVAEYCQWTESSVDDTDKDTGKHGRQYFYTTGWHAFPISSILFEEPLTHHNPQWEPFPNKIQHSTHLSLGSYTILEELVALAAPMTPILSFDTQLNSFLTSPASFDQFKYIGNGYFYYAHQESTMDLVRTLLGYAFGSQFIQHQMERLFAQCEPGDIRIRYLVANVSKGASLIGGLQSQDSIGLYKSPYNQQRIGVFHTSFNVSSQQLVNQETSKFYWNILLARLLVMSVLLIHVRMFSHHRTWPHSFLLTISLSGLLFSVFWMAYWGLSWSLILTSSLSALLTFVLLSVT